MQFFYNAAIMIHVSVLQENYLPIGNIVMVNVSKKLISNLNELYVNQIPRKGRSTMEIKLVLCTLNVHILKVFNFGLLLELLCKYCMAKFSIVG